MIKAIFYTLFYITAVAASAQSPKVIVLGFDGLSGWGVNETQTPNIKKLREQGASTLKAKAVFPTSSSPNWASMIMGASPNEHHITSNKWKRKQLNGKQYCGNQKGKIFPTIFGVLRAQKKEAKIYCVHHWDGFARLTDLDAFNDIVHTKSEYTTAQKAITIIKEKQPDLLFLHFDHCDHAGHEFGHDTPEYFASIRVADSLVNEIIEATKAAGTFSETYFILTADHGGIGKGHGGKNPREVEIPWIIAGPAIKKNFALKDYTVNQYDTAATIAFIFGLKQPDCWIAQPVKEAFNN